MSRQLGDLKRAVNSELHGDPDLYNHVANVIRHIIEDAPVERNIRRLIKIGLLEVHAYDAATREREINEL